MNRPTLVQLKLFAATIPHSGGTRFVLRGKALAVEFGEQLREAPLRA